MPVVDYIIMCTTRRRYVFCLMWTHTYYDHGNGGKALFFNVTAVIINLFRAPVVLLFLFIIISTSASVAGVAITLSIVLATRTTFINSQPASESTCDIYLREKKLPPHWITTTGMASVEQTACDKEQTPRKWKPLFPPSLAYAVDIGIGLVLLLLLLPYLLSRYSDTHSQVSSPSRRLACQSVREPSRLVPEN